MTYAASTNYVLSFESAEELDNGIKEFETYTEAFEAYIQYEISGYSVTIHELGLYR
jgi:hypothetical protein